MYEDAALLKRPQGRLRFLPWGPHRTKWKLIGDEMPPVFLQQNTPVQIWISGNLRCQRVRNVRSLKWNRIGRRIITCMLLIAAPAVIGNLLGP